MKLLAYTDDSGYSRRCLVRDSDSDPARGIPQDPPDLAGLGLAPEEQKRLHNTMVAEGLVTWEDVIRRQNGVTSVLRRLGLGHLRQRVLALYKATR